MDEKDDRPKHPESPDTTSGGESDRPEPISDKDLEAGGGDRSPEKTATKTNEAGAGADTTGETEAVHEWVHPRAGIPAYKWNLTVLGLLLGGLLYGLDTTIAADVQVPVYQTFGDIENLPWVGLGFPMAAVSTILLVGRGYALFNVKTLSLASVVTFELGSALCGAAPNFSTLIVGRVFAGIGGCGMYLGGLTYINHYTVGKEVPLYNALIGLAWGVGAILGPVIGGAFSVSNATWRWSFYINLPLAGLFGPIYIFILLSHNPRPDLTLVQKLARMDWVGGILIIPIISLFMTALTFAGSRYAWDSAATISMLVVWAFCLIFFVLQQSFSWFTTPQRRIFPVWLLRSRTMLLMFLVTGLSCMSSTVALFYVPLYFQFTQLNASALLAAVRLLPFICVFIAFIMVAGVLLPVVGRYALFYVVGGVLLIPGAALMMMVRLGTATEHIYGFEVLIAAGAGITMQTGYAVGVVKAMEMVQKDSVSATESGAENRTLTGSAAQDEDDEVITPSEAASAAAGFINIGQMGASALTLALCACMFQNLGFLYLKKALAQYSLPDDLIRQALAGVSSSSLTTSTDPAIMKIVSIIVETVAFTISRQYAMVVVAGGLLLIAGLLMKWERLSLSIVVGG